MEIRKIDLAERDEILRGDRYAYSQWFHQEFKVSQLGTINPDDVFVAAIAGKIAAALQNFRFRQSVRGIVKPMGGIGGVWTYPEYRNQGCVKNLIKAAFIEMKTKGICVSMLQPFKESFYAAFGYVTANANLELKVPIQALRHYLSQNSLSPASSEPIDRWQWERQPASDLKDPILAFISSLPPQQHHGLAIPGLTYEQWCLWYRHKICVSVKHNGETLAIALYSIDSRTAKEGGTRCIDIYAMFWKNLEARDRLMAFFANHRDQIDYVTMSVPANSHFHTLFRDAPHPIEAIVSHQPWMVRVIDVSEALRDLPAPAIGEVAIAVSDPLCAWNQGVFILRSQEGKLSVTRSDNSQPDLEATIEGISSLVYGTLPLEELLYKQCLKLPNPESNSIDTSNELSKVLLQWFPVVPIFNPFKF
ncbi:GNAT family N-acetyltransferase [Tumidithrix elongata RA019]|uniref:GNAT family N-acetyltransferase n=1 Tax=Tumidithrix elongata BACA0141 TaxID=2716417 RepID=A0AAW9Q0K5_9CYAN|nr:GNAT family N-acetyltransferase [Tumidithrix elongata RA019]